MRDVSGEESDVVRTLSGGHLFVSRGAISGVKTSG